MSFFFFFLFFFLSLGFEFLFLVNVQPKNKKGEKKKEIKLRGVTGKSVQEPRVDPLLRPRPIAQKK